ncbi:MAG TPA: peptide MFS transporter [Lapillicoccus sp.]|nr:peptide MFS transporter [Lapillicoccus sp.]
MTDVDQRPRERPPNEKTFFGQPRVLANLFGVELWERFSFYGMQGILLLYLYFPTDQGGLGISQDTAVGVVGAYGGLVYLSTIAGGWAADRLIGSERTLFYAAVLVMAGHIALSVLPGTLGVGVGLVLIAIGSGGVKANATSLVGTLYSEEDPRRDAGFSIFYLGINLGALLGPLLTGWLQTSYGFHIGFAAAAVGMAIGLIQYTIGRRQLSEAANEVPDPLPNQKRLWYALGIAAGAVIIAVLAVTGVLRATNLDQAVIIVILASTLAYFIVILTSRHVTAVERKRVIAFIPMFIASAAFWSLYQQQFTVLTVYSDYQLNSDIFGWTMPISWVQSINPVFIIILSGVFAAIWTKLGDRQPPTPLKFAAGTVVMGIAFLLFIPMASTQPNSAPLLGLIGVIFVFTIAELLLSPVGLSLATKLAPEAFKTQMVALFFLSVALGTALSGTLAQYYSTDTQVPYFGILGGVAIVIGIALALMTPWLERLMGRVR